MKKWQALIVSGLFMFVAAAAGYFILSAKELRRVGFQFDSWGAALWKPSKFQGKWYWTDDPEFLTKVENWRRNLKRPAVDAALRQGGGRIVLEFKNGTKEEFLTHSLGLTGPGSRFGLNGKHMFSEREPFSEFFRHVDPIGK